eukprot:15087193-Ditylum_brightwellii.AAC.2
MLPISFDTNLPHFEFPIGKDHKNIRLMIAYDACSVFCAEWSKIYLKIAQQSLHQVKNLIWAKDQYTPIILSGIIMPENSREAQEMLTTVLPAVIEYHLLIKTN